MQITNQDLLDYINLRSGELFAYHMGLSLDSQENIAKANVIKGKFQELQTMKRLLIDNTLIATIEKKKSKP